MLLIEVVVLDWGVSGVELNCVGVILLVDVILFFVEEIVIGFWIFVFDDVDCVDLFLVFFVFDIGFVLGLWLFVGFGDGVIVLVVVMMLRVVFEGFFCFVMVLDGLGLLLWVCILFEVFIFRLV